MKHMISCGLTGAIRGIKLSRKTSLSMVVSIVAMLCSAIGNYFLVPPYGASGAAASTAIAFWVFYILRTELSCKVWRSVPRGKSYSIGLILLVSALMGLFVDDASILFVIWGLLFFAGIFIFKGVVKRLCILLGLTRVPYYDGRND